MARNHGAMRALPAISDYVILRQHIVNRQVARAIPA